MFFVGFEVLRETVMTLLSGKEETIDPLGALVGLFSAFVMLGVYLYNRDLAKKRTLRLSLQQVRTIFLMR